MGESLTMEGRSSITDYDITVPRILSSPASRYPGSYQTDGSNSIVTYPGTAVREYRVPSGLRSEVPVKTVPGYPAEIGHPGML